MLRTSRTFCSKIVIYFLSFKYILVKQIVSLLLLNNFYPVISHQRAQKRRIIVYGSVTRYGPQSVASASS